MLCVLVYIIKCNSLHEIFGKTIGWSTRQFVGAGLQISKKDSDLIWKTLNQNTNPSPNKEISFIDNLAQWL